MQKATVLPLIRFANDGPSWYYLKWQTDSRLEVPPIQPTEQIIN